jgi:RNA polymerase sigma factor (TIGR02999 family)
VEDDPPTETDAQASSNEPRAASELLPLLYTELRDLGSALLQRQPPGQTLQATALVHEAYARLVAGNDAAWDGRGHFFAAAARAMRDILVEDARRRAARKRGGDRKRVNADPAVLPIVAPCEDVLAFNEVLERLEERDPQKGKIVLLRFFAGLSMQETADELGLSKTKVEREWRYVRAWLYKELEDLR